MEIKKLWCFIDAHRALKIAWNRLTEYEAIIYSPGGVRASGMPLEHSHNSPDRLAIVAETHKKLIKAHATAQANAAAAYSLLLEFEANLTDDEKDVFLRRFIQGKTVKEIQTELYKCERTVRYNLRKIKAKFKNFAPICT